MTAEVYPDNMRGNEHLIEIMLRNILDNAVKYCMVTETYIYRLIGVDWLLKMMEKV